MRQGIRLEPVLQAVSNFLDDQHFMMGDRVQPSGARPEEARQRSRRFDAHQVLRSLVLMRVKNWDYRELRERIAMD